MTTSQAATLAPPTFKKSATLSSRMKASISDIFSKDEKEKHSRPSLYLSVSSAPSLASLPSYRSSYSYNYQVCRCPSYNSSEQEPIYINAISFDGGGVRGVSSAMIIAVLMNDLSAISGKPEHAYQQFHVMAGTSTGGLIALMLGRLKAPADEVLEKYTSLSKRLFDSRCRTIRSVCKGCKYSSTTARKIFGDIISEYCFAGSGELLQSEPSHGCGVFVTTINTADTTGEPLLMRSYNEQCYHTVLEAAEATTAAPSYFTPKTLSTGEVVIDGGVRFNNPSELLLKEARKKFGHNVRFRLFLSIGTGEKAPLVMKRCRDGRALMSFPRTMSKMMTDSEAVHQRMFARFEETNLGTYFRINVPAIGDVNLDDFKSIPAMLRATEIFMSTPHMLELRKEILALLTGSGAPSEIL